MSKLAIHLNEEAKKIDFSAISKNDNSAKVRVRAMILNNVKNGKSKAEIARFVGVHRVTVTAYINRVNEKGVSGLRSKKQSGRPPKMDAEQEQLFAKKFEEAGKNRSGGRMTGYDAQQILKALGFAFGLARTYELLHKLGLSWITSRPIHPKANQEAQDSFKKTSQRKSGR